MLQIAHRWALCTTSLPHGVKPRISFTGQAEGRIQKRWYEIQYHQLSVLPPLLLREFDAGRNDVEKFM